MMIDATSDTRSDGENDEHGLGTLSPTLPFYISHGLGTLSPTLPFYISLSLSLFLSSLFFSYEGASPQPGRSYS